ncbi:MAG: pyruvate kinase [Alphaproteobacteria bacterium]|nr:pyruvate kinase [Alphaproteobacteria bacterium]
MYNFTKIVASIGPKSDTRKTIRDMVVAGADLFRINFSHDTGAVQGRKIDLIRDVAAELGKPVGVIVDLQGPKHRIGDFETEEHYPLKVGGKFTFDDDPAPGNSKRVNLPDKDVLQSLKVDDRILLNDGKIEMRVESVTKHKVIATVVRGTEIWSRRGFNLPDTEVATSPLTAKDRHDLEYAITKRPDYVAVSFVQRGADIAYVRDFIARRSAYPIKIIAKIERPNAVERIDEIARAADGIMIARGDLAVEVPYEEVPAITRHIIRTCRMMNRPVIIATQMLASMVDSEFPTRAEISDVANTAYLRADSAMTSEETTVGINPVNTVEKMARILSYSDKDTVANPYDWSRVDNVPENDWSRSVSSMAYLNHAVAIVVFARDADAVAQISCRKPDIPIIAVCNDSIVANQLCLLRGVSSIYDEQLFGMRDGFNTARRFGIHTGKLVIVDDEKISLRTLD